MKVRCPRCQKKLAIPDKYAGKAIRCPSCSKPFTLPALSGDASGRLDATRMDLEGLASLERQSSGMERRELAAAEADIKAHAKAAAATAPPNERICPNCNKRTRVDDPYVEVLCSHCWNPIPALVKGGTTRHAGGLILAKTTGPGAFYGELAGSLAYPIPAISSIATASVVAICAALAPVAVLTAMTYLMEQSNVGLDVAKKATDLTFVQWILVGIFAFEVFFFNAVAIHTFLDVIRASVIGNRAPPNLGWSPNHWGKSFLGYFVIVLYLAAATVLVVFLTVEGDVVAMARRGEIVELMKAGGTPLVVGLVVVSCGIPMNLLGLGLGSIAQAVNPVRIFKSIGRTHAHYAFLVLLLVLYGVMFASAFVSIVFEWFLPKIDTMVAGAAAGDVLQVALALLAWGVVMAVYFFGIYVLARLHGIFALAFRKQLEFGSV